MKSNFAFLEKDFHVLASFGYMAEKYLYSDSNSCLMKLGMIGETITKLMFKFEHIKLPFDLDSCDRIRHLFKEGFLEKDIVDILHSLRKIRNRAAHENYESVKDGETIIKMAYGLCQWFQYTYGDPDMDFHDAPFVMPSKDGDEIESSGQRIPGIIQITNEPASKDAEKAEEEKLITESEKAAEKAKPVAKEERQQQSQKAASLRFKSEEETRYIIDEQLREVGWEADSKVIKYSEGVRPSKNKNMAIAEWPTLSADGKKGFADYALFIGEKLYAFIEAKAAMIDVSSVIDNQCKVYSASVRNEDQKYCLGTWGKYCLPFTFATNGRAYLEQLSTKSGVWFLDLRKPDNVSKPLMGWYSPNGLLELFEKDIDSRNTALSQLSKDFLRDRDGLNLRYYQINAIEAAENAVVGGQQNVLLAMATGTGKTRTVLGMIYRFLKSGRFRRILFLVDRTTLGDQASDTFKEVKLEDLMTLNDIYNIKGLEDTGIDRETRVQVATVQSMVKRILYNKEDTMPAVSDYDLIIVDEAHRGYVLDKEMTDEEILYRDQTDYQSKYRVVIEYFDAVKIALTATPALHTTEIFGAPVFSYTYREAVIDGYLVDHDAPHQLKTKLGQDGVHYKVGDVVSVYNPSTGQVVQTELIADELNFEIDSFNKQIVVPSFNETVLAEIANCIDPEDSNVSGKTIIFAVDDHHADLIVHILQKIYSARGIPNEAIMKITSSVNKNNSNRAQELVKLFKNENYPSIAVTVDLLSTGIDVPKITNLVFMRRIRSRILFEQMLGRATRLCPEIGKSRFEIYDPVGVYDAFSGVNTMKSVAVKTSYDDLLKGLRVLDEEEQLRKVVDQMLAKLQRSCKNMDEKTEKNFPVLAGGMQPEEFMKTFQGLSAVEAKEKLIANEKLIELMKKNKGNPPKGIIISNEKDKLLAHTRSYGKAAVGPKDYLDSFAEYLRENKNTIEALNILCTRPKDLTRASLKSLWAQLDTEGYSETELKSALKEMTNSDITADIISIVRRYAINAELVSAEERVKTAIEKLKKAHKFNATELNWLSKIEKVLLKDSIINVAVFNEDSRFRERGGFDHINKVFGNKLASIVDELNDYLYEVG